DLEVLAGLDAVNAALVVLDPDVVAAGGDAVDGRGSLQEPHALGEQEVLVEQRAHRADVDDVRAQLVVQRPAGEDIDLALVAAAGDHQLARAGHFAGEAHAAGAHDAAIGVEGDVRPDILLGLLDLLLLEAAGRAAVLVAVVLQVALTRLVADGAVQRVVDQQVL